MDPIGKIKDFAPGRRAYSLAEEFRNFAFKGNIVDLAVGVVIGAAFTNFINSLVKNVLMPLITLLIPGEQSYTKWAIEINGKEIPIGLFLADSVNFLIVAAAVFFFIVKFLGWVTRARKQEAEAPAPLTKEQELLTEIRDLLKKPTAS
jgi:large conductance mechanosensitive channel